jgi:hypothetical protein
MSAYCYALKHMGGQQCTYRDSFVESIRTILPETTSSNTGLKPPLTDLCWGGGLRAADTFSLDNENVEIITPSNGALRNLPIGVGAVLLTLGPGRHFCIND